MDTRPEPASENVWLSPLLPPAIAVTAGVAVDRCLEPPFVVSLLAAAAFLVAAIVLKVRRLGMLYLLVALAALGCAYHAWRCRLVRPDEVAFHAEDTPRPVRLRGVVAEGPRRAPAQAGQSQRLRSQPPAPAASMLLSVTHLIEAGGERELSGTVRVVVAGKPGQAPEELLADLLTGDEVEATGRLFRIEGPGNPGEFDTSRYWTGQGVRAALRVRPTEGVQRLREGWRTSPAAWLGIVRGRAHEALREELKDEPIEGLARALLLGEGAPMTHEDWAKYVRTGVVHAIAISGQHLVVVAAVVWVVLFRLGVRQRHGAILVALLLLGYALLTGARPPALRAAVVCCAFCGAIVFRRPALSANLFALAWLVVLAVNPASAFEGGCQLSFLAVAVLAWCVPRFFPERPPDPLEVLIDEARPTWLRGLRWLGVTVGKSYLINLIVWGAITPLAAYHSGVVAPSALLLGPPLALLTAIAIVLGFGLLLAGLINLAWLFSYPLSWSLLACDWLVDLAEAFRAHLYCGEVPVWWLVIFYAALFAVFTCPPLLARWRRIAPAAVAWVALLLILGAFPRPVPELRVTFLDVGHGGCTVVQTPDGRVLLYDAGAMRGPDVTGRVIAPFLWSQGIRRIDDVVLSHPDLDHFNGVTDLAERFAIGRVLAADSFAERKTSAIAHTLDELDRRKIPLTKVGAGDRLMAADVTIDVLHPPRGWVGRTTNEQSVVLLIRHADRSLLLTGDLEGEGLAALLRQPPREIDLLQAPHHGSGQFDVEGLLRWSRPRLAVSCQAAPTSDRTGQRYRSAGVPLWTTWQHGAITVSAGRGGLRVRGHRGAARDLAED